MAPESGGSTLPQGQTTNITLFKKISQLDTLAGDISYLTTRQEGFKHVLDGADRRYGGLSQLFFLKDDVIQSGCKCTSVCPHMHGTQTAEKGVVGGLPAWGEEHA